MNNPRSIFTAPGSFDIKSKAQDTSDDPWRTSRRSTNPELISAIPIDRPSSLFKRRPIQPHTGPLPSQAPYASLVRDSRTLLTGVIVRGRSASSPEPRTTHAPPLSRSILPPRPSLCPRTPPNPRKRQLSESTANQALSEPFLKRPRLQHPCRHILGRFDFAGPSINSAQPPSPLFFSNSTHIRPSLPARFSSSEAAARMLSKAKMEDSHIKTVSLARGTVTTPAIPTSVPMRALSDISGTMRSASPEITSRDPSPLRMISSIGVVELLEQDDRPTMIVDLADTSNYGSGPLRPLFANASLRSLSDLLQLVTGMTEGATRDDPALHSYLQFKSWLLSASVNGESLNVCLPSFDFAGVSWSCSTLRKRLRLVSGAFNRDDASPIPRAKQDQSLAATRSPLNAASKPRSGSSRSTMLEEPHDYFGAAVPSRPKALPFSPSYDIIPTTETPAALRAPSITPLSVASLTTGSGYSPALSLDTLQVTEEEPSFDWTRLPITDAMPPHIKFARSVDWPSTALGPIEYWSSDLRQMCNLIMASPHPAAMYWGDDLIAIYNEAYVQLAGQKHPTLMGQSYREAWAEIWDEVKEVFANAKTTGEATMKDDDCLFMKRNDYLEETYFSWSIIPMVGNGGSVMGLYNPAFEKTRRKIAERRMLTLREIGERTASARDVGAFWEQVLAALELNEYDTPFVLLYSVADESESDASSIYSSSITGNMLCTLEGSLGVPEDHPAAQTVLDLKGGSEGFGPALREVMKGDKPVLLEVGTKDLPASLLDGLEKRGFGDPCRAVVVCPIHPTTGDTILGFLVLGVNPRRPYDDDYNLFVQLLSRQLATSLASVVLFEEEIRRGQRAAKLAALDRMELSQQLAVRTQQAIESETRFTRMAEFAPVGMFIADSEGKITYCNDTWFEISRIPKDVIGLAENWTNNIHEEDQPSVSQVWTQLVTKKEPTTSTFRFKTPWRDPDGTEGERWVLFSAYPEKYENGGLKCVFGSFTDISKQKWAEGFQKRKMEEAVELKRQQENFIDMTSHEMRNPLSAILQCADEISTRMIGLRQDTDSNGNEAMANRVTKQNGATDGIDDTFANTLEAAQTIALCAQHQKRIVDDILTLSKLDSQLLLVTPVDAQPLTVVQRALKMHEGELQSNDIQLKFVVHDSYSKVGIDWVRFDPSRVLQVLINLTTNAIKFTTTEKKRTITVHIAASIEQPSKMEKQMVSYFPSRRPERHQNVQEAGWGDGETVYIQFAVEDTGRGLTPEEKKMLFLRFSQASPRTHVQYGGSGLGLFISRELTELQGGEIGVASEAGKGSTFAFYVRARRSPGPPAAGASDGLGSTFAFAQSDSNDAASKRGMSHKTKHILLVEDNLVNQRVLQKQLKNLGCVVHVANHGGEALDMLRKSRWWTHGDEKMELSVVLMDQEMPVMDGLTATRKIREMEREGKFVKHVPVIAVTANARGEQIQTALDAGMDDVVSKPFRIPDLIPKIEELMAKYPEPES